MWSNYGKTFIEYAHLNSFKKSSNHIKIKNLEFIDELKNNNDRLYLYRAILQIMN